MSRPQEEAARRAAFEREQQLAFDHSQRRVSFLIPMFALLVAVPLVLLVPGAQEATGMSFRKTMAANLAIVIQVVAATAAYHARGPTSVLYRVLEWFETLVAQCAIGYVVASSGDPTNFYWLFYLVHVLLLSVRPGPAWHHALQAVAAPTLVVIMFLGDGASSNVIFPFAAGATGMLVYTFGVTLQRQVTSHAFAQTESEAALAALQVAADRSRIARDLHDGLAADLTAMAWRAEALSLRDVVPPEDLGQISERARAALDDTRAVVWALEGKPFPWDLLCDQIEARCVQLRSAEQGLTVSLDRRDGADINGATALNIMRMIQEMVRNAVQHADAEHISVTVTRDEARIEIEVRDDGVGLASSREREEHGLANIRQRVGKERGEIAIAGGEGGTHIRIVLPGQHAEPA